jgi:cytosine/adenosine deaminase-related metal-dependent hydrolase
LAGGQSILEELKAARDQSQFDWKKTLNARELSEMVTRAPSQAFGLGKRAGHLVKGAPADFTVLSRKKHADGWTSLVEARVNDLELVVASGRPLLAKERFMPLVKNSGAPGQKVSIHGEPYWLAGKPLDLRKRVEAALGAPPAWRFFPVGV